MPKPATHLDAGVAAWEIDDIEVRKHLPRQFQTLSIIHPSVVLPAIETEGYGTVKRKRWIESGEVIACGMPHLDGASLNRFQHLVERDEFASWEDADAKASVGQLRNPLGHDLGGAKNGIQ